MEVSFVGGIIGAGNVIIVGGFISVDCDFRDMEVGAGDSELSV